MTKQDEFHCALEDDDFEKIKLLLKNKNVDPRFNKGYSIGMACHIGNKKVISLILEDNRVDPSEHNNWIIENAYRRKDQNLVNLLWNDKRVKSTLQNNHPELYSELIKKDILNKVGDF
jgi:hypothetical protein